eukprot:CAMPEP_0174375742 /NCGR_PEP_ID=MMETSP0811_2-20130205/115685_1 /TAXON_ID=73025 ORGANISM="Eutreptiella gymnastica-like, Strain CCMP1594" /NCGR_SAMPLE_ID=MMETSP0811_2 /ASSEMBLY_ACC=CAM_ASM_000667 /LENGTH=82 /DNA_ID=CAMNT_0015526277 /DNA_START=555 /DNA_END=800 /DNA_ORIENTATION=+
MASPAASADGLQPPDREVVEGALHYCMTEVVTQDTGGPHPHVLHIGGALHCAGLLPLASLDQACIPKRSALRSVPARDLPPA